MLVFMRRCLGRLHSRLDGMLTTDHFTYKEIRAIFVPLIFDQLFIYLIGMLSSAMVSSSSQTAMAAVSLVGPLGFIVTALFMSISSGGAIVVAQSKGHGDVQKMRGAIGQSISLTTLVAMCMTLVFLLSSDVMVELLYRAAEPDVKAMAARYLRVYALSYIPYAIFHAIFSVFRAIGDSRSSLVLTIVINVVHLICSFILITLMGMSAVGAALSYVIARVIGAAMAFFWLFKLHNQYAVTLGRLTKFSREIVRGVFKLGVPFALEQVLFQMGSLITQTFIAALAVEEIAANAIANSMYNIFFATAFALTTLATTICGQCAGAGDYDGVRRYARNFIKIGRFVMLGTIVVILPFSPLLLSLYSPEEAALPHIVQALAIGLVLMPVLWCDAYVTPSALRAAGDAVYTSASTLVALWVGRVGVAYLLAIVFELGVPGLWFGVWVDWIIRIIMMRPRLRGVKWIPKEPSA